MTADSSCHFRHSGSIGRIQPSSRSHQIPVAWLGPDPSSALDSMERSFSSPFGSIVRSTTICAKSATDRSLIPPCACLQIAEMMSANLSADSRSSETHPRSALKNVEAGMNLSASLARVLLPMSIANVLTLASACWSEIVPSSSSEMVGASPRAGLPSSPPKLS
jgi:hypothetical protein